MKKVVIAGGSGFIGQLLASHFAGQNWEVIILTRRHRLDQNNIHYVEWDAKSLGYWTIFLEAADVIINLNGKSVDCRYNKQNKEEIYASRIQSTWILQKAIEQMNQPPELWVNASSATIYRHSIDQPMSEDKGEIGSGFSVDVVKKWESTFFKKPLPNTRKVALRIAIVLGKEGGALQPLLGLSRLGFGGKQGKGNQMFSWIHEEDLIHALDYIIEDTSLEGVFNISAPEPLENSRVMKLIRKAVHRPIGLPMPKWVLELGARVIKTETELILKSRYVVPERLNKSGFTFKFPNFQNAIQNLVHE